MGVQLTGYHNVILGNKDRIKFFCTIIDNNLNSCAFANEIFTPFHWSI